MESGFIYLWYDQKHKRYYLGKHWGPEDDGYICSSTWMKNAYRRRPQDFGKRRILERITTSRKDLGEAEYRWGLLIKESELGKRYYNLRRPGEDGHWSEDPDRLLTVSQKIGKIHKGLPKPKSVVHRSKLSASVKVHYDKIGRKPKRVRKKTWLWIVTSPNGEVFEMKNLKAFCREKDLHASHIRGPHGSKGWRATKKE